MGSRTYNYYGYFDSCHYYFEFSANDINDGQVHDTLGHLLI
jgi:hypothetical protein